MPSASSQTACLVEQREVQTRAGSTRRASRFVSQPTLASRLALPPAAVVSTQT